MLVLDSYELDELPHETPTTVSKKSVAERSLAVMVSSIQWCIAVTFFVTIVSAGTWSVQHQWMGYTVFFLSVVLCSAINPIHRSRKYFNSSLIQSDTRIFEEGIPPRLQRRTGIMLMVLVGITIISGWMYRLEFFWGLVWIEDIHTLAAYAAACLLFLYCAMALYFKYGSDSSE